MKTPDFPLVLHIGYHKTATTYLQEHVFNNNQEILYLGRRWVKDELRVFFRKYKFTHDLDFDPVLFKSDFENILAGIQDNAYSGWNPKVCLISHESLHSGPEWFGMDVVGRAYRMKHVFPRARIIIGIRNQLDYIESNYKEYVFLGGKLGFKEFFYESFACNCCLLPKLQYDKVISLYRKLFGDDNIHVYLQEELKSDHDETLDELMEFLGVTTSFKPKQEKVNIGLNNFSTCLLRVLNRVLAYDFTEQYYRRFMGKANLNEYIRWRAGHLLRLLAQVLFKKGKKRRLMKKAEIQNITDYFSESNKTLSEMLNKNLKRLGYP